MLFRSVMQESFRHAQRIILKIIGGHPDLSDQLLLGCRQLRRSHFHIPHSFQFLIGQFQTRNVRGEINLERIYIQVYYNSKDVVNKLYNLHFNYTSDKFDEFLANVRDENSYWEVLKLYKPVKYEVTMDKLF